MSQNVLYNYPIFLPQDLQSIIPHVFSTTSFTITDAFSETQDQMMEIESALRQQDQTGPNSQELEGKNIQQGSSMSEQNFLFDIESMSNIVEAQDQQNEEENMQTKSSSSKHNFPKFFVGDIISILGKGKQNQQKIQSNQIMQHYKKFVLSLLEKQKSISCLRKHFIEGIEDAAVLKQFKSYAKKKKAHVQLQQDDLSLLKVYLRSLLIQKSEEMAKMAEGRKIEDRDRLRKYIEFVSENMNELKKGKLRGKAKKTASIRRGRDNQ